MFNSFYSTTTSKDMTARDFKLKEFNLSLFASKRCRCHNKSKLDSLGGGGMHTNQSKTSTISKQTKGNWLQNYLKITTLVSLALNFKFTCNSYFVKKSCWSRLARLYQLQQLQCKENIQKGRSIACEIAYMVQKHFLARGDGQIYSP